MNLKRAGAYHQAARRYWRSVLTGQRYAGTGRASEEQNAYAAVLDVGMKAGLLGLVITFLIYVSGALTPHVPLADLPQYWTMPVDDYLRAANVPSGWGWVGLLRKGDFLAILPVAFLATLSILCYLRILPLLLMKRERIYATIVLAEVCVLSAVAAGVFGGGH